MSRLLRVAAGFVVPCLVGCNIATEPNHAAGWFAPAADTSILVDPAKGNRALDSIFVGCNRIGTAHRGLIRFDLSQLPADAHIVSAVLELSLLKTRSTGDQVQVYRLRESWAEDSVPSDGARAANMGGATWGSRSRDLGAWSTAGGHRNSNASATIKIDGVERWTIQSEAMAQDVQGWIRDPKSNCGWLLVGDEKKPLSVMRFAGRQHHEIEKRPRLVILYHTD